MSGSPKSKRFWKKFMLGERSKEGRIRADFKGEDIRGEDLKETTHKKRPHGPLVSLEKEPKKEIWRVTIGKRSHKIRSSKEKNYGRTH